nr:glutaminase A [Sphingomonas sp. BT553]
MQHIVDEVATAIVAEAATIEASADAKEEGVAPGPFGIAVATTDGRVFTAGDIATGFPIQSISKVFALELALSAIGDDVFHRVGREPSGDPFNSMIDLERNKGVPRNPFINAGALVVVDMLVEQFPDDRAEGAVLRLVQRAIGGGETIGLDDDVLASGEEAGDLNRAMMYFAKAHGNLHAPVDDVMTAYVRQCAITLNCRQLALAGRFLADTAHHPDDPDADRTARRMRRLLALMTTCGHYDGSGDFAYRVGLPAKSGVGGGIIAVAPGIASIATWSPNLDQHGNSILGVHALEMLCDRTGWSAFA